MLESDTSATRRTSARQSGRASKRGCAKVEDQLQQLVIEVRALRMSQRPEADLQPRRP
jgi:hypothetical protein